ncbi:pseudoazurin [Marinomonas sp. PE14-40]|uniref:pseudoazurin n=1 Tax=Marinomonas sp. PE14-40 TaxID=3060621 RepID=UPI003F66DB5E
MFEASSLFTKVNRLFTLAVPLLLLSTPVLSAHFEVKMLNVSEQGNMVFEPAVLEVAVGDTVTFIPQDRGHDSVSVYTPQGAATWHGKRGKKVRVTIDKEGVYLYKCAPHYYYGMFGVIYAGKLENLEEAKAEAKKHSDKFVANKERLTGYLKQVKGVTQ